MSKIIAIGTALPPYRHEQKTIFNFMHKVYALNEVEKRKLKFMYNLSGIEARYSVLPDYSLPAGEWDFYPASENLEPFPTLEKRMAVYNSTAAPLSIVAIENCLGNTQDKKSITHLISVSCTGMSAPGLDLQIMEMMGLSQNIFRTSVNFMGCYAAIHAMKLADSFCKNDKDARVVIVCTELCTLHFQQSNTFDNLASSLLFGDGSAAILVVHDHAIGKGPHIKEFYSEVSFEGKRDMSWELSSTGFLMTLSGYLPDLVEKDFESLLSNSLMHANLQKKDITHWCLHPGGKKILSAIEKSADLADADFKYSNKVLNDFGNMSSPTILFVLQEIMNNINTTRERATIFGAAFGPGLTMETFILSDD